MKRSDAEMQLGTHRNAILVNECGEHCRNGDFVGGTVGLALIPRQNLSNWLSRTVWVALGSRKPFYRRDLKSFISLAHQ